MIEHGHLKKDILSFYTRDEINIFYQKCIAEEARSKADNIEAVIAGIGGALSGDQKITKLLEDLRSIT